MSDVEKASSEFDEAYEDERKVRGAIFTEELGNVPRRDPLLVDVSTSVAQTIRLMNERHVGCALVVRGGKLAGIFTERDVLRKVAATTMDVEHTPVEHVMTENPDTLPATATVAFALREMSVEGYRHIPLVDASGVPTGVIAVRDLIVWLVDCFPASVHNLPPTAVIATTLDGG